GRVFTCADVAELIVLPIYVSIIVYQNGGYDTLQDFVNTTLDIQDGNGFCSEDALANITVRGRIITSMDEYLRTAEVRLEGVESKNQMSDQNGLYVFANMPAGITYDLRPVKDDD